MGVRENKVESYLDEKIKELGGVTRKWVSPGVDGVTDRIIRLPHWSLGVVHMVEVKTEDGVLSAPQHREQERLADLGCIVITLFGHAGVDRYIEMITEGLVPEHKEMIH